MRTVIKACMVAVLGIANAGLSIAQTQSSTETRSLGDIARELRAQKQAVAASAAPEKPASPQAQVSSPAVVGQSADKQQFDKNVRTLLLREDFAALDKVADDVRSTKARFAGGSWKLTSFYAVLAEMRASSFAGEADWKQHIAVFRRWVAARPKSITARIALAEAYHGHAWAARGHGYSDSVTEQGWQMFGERMDEAARTLVEAAKLPTMCPHWYELMQQVARDKGADKDALRAVFEKAIAFEPDYYRFYQEFAGALSTRWSGDPGDVKAFADETYRRLGPKKGAFFYFQIVSPLCNDCGEMSPEEFSWPQIKEGFAVMEELYGVEPHKLNQFARLAVVYKDREVASKTFQRIGENWETEVWGSRARFESLREWAGVTNAAAPPQPADAAPDVRWSGLIGQGQRAASEQKWDEADRLIRASIPIAEGLPPSSNALMQSYAILIGMYQIKRDLNKAASLVPEALDAVTKKYGPKSKEVATMLIGEGSLMLAQAKFAEARTAADKSLAITRALPDPDQIQIMNALLIAGSAYSAEGKYQQSETSLLEALKVAERPHAEDDGRTIPALGSLGSMYEASHQYTLAIVMFERLLQVHEKLYGVGNPLLGPALAKLAQLYALDNRPADAAAATARKQKLEAPLEP